MHPDTPELVNITLGSWVTSYSAGVWRVFRIIRDYVDLSPLHEKSPAPLVFSARFLTAKGNARLSVEACSLVFVELLQPEALAQLQHDIENNPKKFAAFDRAEVRSPDLVYNRGLGAEPTEAQEIAPTLKATLRDGLTFPTIKDLVSSSAVGPTIGKYPIVSTLQFVCREHEIEDRQFIFRDVNVLHF